YLQRTSFYITRKRLEEKLKRVECLNPPFGACGPFYTLKTTLARVVSNTLLPTTKRRQNAVVLINDLTAGTLKSSLYQE
ncbi:unnamed protein product, partial [Ectocarpus sp. 6 AP-2014]